MEDQMTQRKTREVKPAPKGDRRTKYPATAKVTKFTKANPHRPGTKDHASFAALKTGRTVAAALAAGCDRNYLAWTARRGMIKVAGV
jgi:hypothetical protein